MQLGLNRKREARQLAESAFARQPASVDAQRLLLRIDAQDGQIDRALARARSLASTTGRPVGELEGDTYALAGKLDDALRSYEAAQRARPNAELAIKIFNARRATKQELPERSLIEWLDKEPGDQGVRRLLAQHYEASGQRREAIAEYERLAAAGKDPFAMNNLAWILAESGDARALDLARRAHEQAPGVAEIADTYGWILVRSDKVGEGVTCWRRRGPRRRPTRTSSFISRAPTPRLGVMRRRATCCASCSLPTRHSLRVARPSSWRARSRRRVRDAASNIKTKG